MLLQLFHFNFSEGFVTWLKTVSLNKCQLCSKQIRNAQKYCVSIGCESAPYIRILSHKIDVNRVSFPSGVLYAEVKHCRRWLTTNHWGEIFWSPVITFWNDLWEFFWIHSQLWLYVTYNLSWKITVFKPPKASVGVKAFYYPLLPVIVSYINWLTWPQQSA